MAIQKKQLFNGTYFLKCLLNVARGFRKHSVPSYTLNSITQFNLQTPTCARVRKTESSIYQKLSSGLK